MYETTTKTTYLSPFSLKQVEVEVEVEVSNQILLSANVQSTPFSNTEKD